MTNKVVALWRQPAGSGGRDAELSALTRELDQARALGRARFAFLRGPAGVGKSHLFRLLRQAVSARGGDVFEADSAREHGRPFGLFAHLCPQLVEHLEHAGVPRDVLLPLARRVAALSEGARGPEQDRLSLFDAVSELFVLAGRGHPLFLFPDLDAADKSSLELFRYLVAVVSAPESCSGGLFVASFRDDDALPAPLEEVLSRVSALTVSLGGLDLEGIRAFLSRDEVAQRLYEATAGIPDALEALLTRPQVKPQELFTRRVERLSAGAREVLDLLGVSPVALSLEAVAAGLERVTGRKDAAARAAAELDLLVRQHLVAVKVVGSAPLYRFARDVEKAALVHGMEPVIRRRTALALGRALEAQDDLVTAARLLLEADPASGARVALGASDLLQARGAAEEAQDLLLDALPHLPADERPAVNARLAALCAQRGQAREAIRYLSRARRRSDAAAATALKVTVAGHLLRLGRTRTAERLLEDPLAHGAPEVRARAAVQKVELLLQRSRPDDALALARTFEPALGTQPALHLELCNLIGRAHLLKGALSDADDRFARNAEAAAVQGLPRLRARALVNRGVVAHKKGDRAAAIRFYEAAAPDAERAVEAPALANLGSLYAEDGQFELALEHLSRALQAVSRLGSAREVAHAAVNLGRLCAFLGDLGRASELSDHALRRATEIGDRYLQAQALLNLGELELDRERLHDAQKLLEDARELFEQVGNEGYAALASAQKARAHLGLGERAQAQADLARKVMERGSALLPAATVEAELCRGDLALALGDLHGAGRATTRAREALLRKPDLEGPYRVYFLMGQLRQAAGDAQGAQAELSRAARLLDELTQRVPPARRQAFLSVPRRAQVLAAVEPELRLPRLQAVAAAASAQPHGLIGRSEPLLRITRQIEPIARANATVLIRGESGTGKELLAQAIHDLSGRKGMPLVKVNCAAMVEELLLSELFGHEKGAFTGAIRERKGRFELADGGTIFLDEIGDISPRAQVALLRVLQEREFERVGGTRTLKVDVRVICATNRDLESLITQGRFRQDLYYRLKGVMLELPPLRDRPEDLPVLAQHFLERVAKERGEAPRQLSGESLALLRRHTWPGNVRELENVLASAAIFAEGTLITPDCFSHVAELTALGQGAAAASPAAAPVPAPEPVIPTAPDAPSDDEDEQGSGARVDDVDFYSLARTRGLSLRELRHQLELQCIRRALIDARGNISEAARLLKMKRSRLSQIVNSEPELKGVCHGDA